MYKLYLKSTRNPIDLSDEVGKKVKAFFESTEVADDEKIVTTFWSGTKSSIRDIIFEREDTGLARGMSDMRMRDMLWRRERSQFQNRPLDERANDLAWFYMLYQSLMKKGPSEVPAEDVAMAVEIQREFFGKNPYRCVCNIDVLAPLMRQSLGTDIVLGGIIKVALWKDMEYAEKEASYNSSYERSV